MLTVAKKLAGIKGEHKLFGGINIILVGDFHQFPPVFGQPLYWRLDNRVADEEDLLDWSIYEEFRTVVRLKQQMRVVDSEWLDVLRHVRNGNCGAHHLDILHSVTISPGFHAQDNFSTHPWNDAVLIMPRHSVRRQWNEAMCIKHSQSQSRQLFICKADDTINGRAPSLQERFAMEAKRGKGSRQKENKQANLPDEIMFFVGMKAMITVNVETDLEIANGSRGQVVGIVLNKEESFFSANEGIIYLTKLPAYLLVKMKTTKIPQLPGLEEGVIPLTFIKCSFNISVGNEKKTVKRKQMPLTPAYTFTDYRSQGQTINYAIIDIATPPSGKGLTAFNVYVSLTRCQQRDNIRILRPFDTRLMTTHPCEYLRLEEERLEYLEEETERAWLAMNGVAIL